jgi:hypothetical protein
MPTTATLTPTLAASSKEPRIVETCRGTAHPVRRLTAAHS